MSSFIGPRFVIALWSCLAIAPPLWAHNPRETIQLLDQAFRQSELVSYDIVAEFRMQRGGATIQEHRSGSFLRDGRRYAVRYAETVGTEIDRRHQLHPSLQRHIYVNQKGLLFTTDGEFPPGYLYVIDDPEEAQHRARVFLGPCAAVATGRFAEDPVSIVEILKGARHIEAGPASTQDAGPGGESLVALAADTEYGRYRLWLDPSLSYWPRRIHVIKAAADLTIDGRVSDLRASGSGAHAETHEMIIEFTDFQRDGELFHPRRAEARLTTRFGSGVVEELTERTRLESVQLGVRPDDASFTPFLPDGTPVVPFSSTQAGISGVSYEWRAGRVVEYVDPDAGDKIDGSVTRARGTSRSRPLGLASPDLWLWLLGGIVIVIAAVGIVAAVIRRHQDAG